MHIYTGAKERFLPKGGGGLAHIYRSFFPLRRNIQKVVTKIYFYFFCDHFYEVKMVILKCMTEGLNFYLKVLIWGPVFIEIHTYLLNLVHTPG